MQADWGDFADWQATNSRQTEWWNWKSAGQNVSNYIQEFSKADWQATNSRQTEWWNLKSAGTMFQKTFRNFQKLLTFFSDPMSMFWLQKSKWPGCMETQSILHENNEPLLWLWQSVSALGKVCSALVGIQYQLKCYSMVYNIITSNVKR